MDHGDLRPLMSLHNPALFDTTQLQAFRDNELQRNIHAKTSRSWIWDLKLGKGKRRNEDQDDTEDEDEDWLVVWSQARANRDCWDEELLLIQEEMRWTVCYFVWEMERWNKTAMPSNQDFSNYIQIGKMAYAHKQVQFRNELITICINTWKPVFERHGLAGSWMQRPLNRWDS